MRNDNTREGGGYKYRLTCYHTRMLRWGELHTFLGRAGAGGSRLSVGEQIPNRLVTLCVAKR